MYTRSVMIVYGTSLNLRKSHYNIDLKKKTFVYARADEKFSRLAYITSKLWSLNDLSSCKFKGNYYNRFEREKN